jgi:hypothetical protein
MAMARNMETRMAVATNPNDTALTPLSSWCHRISSCVAAADPAPGHAAGAIAGPLSMAPTVTQSLRPFSTTATTHDACGAIAGLVL